MVKCCFVKTPEVTGTLYPKYIILYSWIGQLHSQGENHCWKWSNSDRVFKDGALFTCDWWKQPGGRKNWSSIKLNWKPVTNTYRKALLIKTEINSQADVNLDYHRTSGCHLVLPSPCWGIPRAGCPGSCTTGWHSWGSLHRCFCLFVRKNSALLSIIQAEFIQFCKTKDVYAPWKKKALEKKTNLITNLQTFEG